jgi:AcrR family transcriptional regulator
MPRRKDLQLSRDLIAEAALGLFREHGVGALTTRRVAETLGASPMSLYLHVGNKEGLLDAVVERLMLSIKIDLDSEGSWKQQAEQWAHALREQLRPHEGVMTLLATRRWAVVRSTEPLIRALLSAGFSTERAVVITRLLTWSTIGFLSVEAGVRGEGDGERRSQATQVEDSLDQLQELEGRPGKVLSDRARIQHPREIDALFSLQLRTIIRGLEAENDGEEAS